MKKDHVQKAPTWCREYTVRKTFEACKGAPSAIKGYIASPEEVL